jgi:formyltetrahydrofolate hydrolase
MAEEQVVDEDLVTLVRNHSNVEFYVAERNLSFISIDLTKVNIATTKDKIETLLTEAFNEIVSLTSNVSSDIPPDSR